MTALSEFELDQHAGAGLELPARLREISGLAMTPDGRALGHGDEAGIIYEIDIARGEVVKAFRLGNKTVRADFEGIAVAGNNIYLVTSDGTIYESAEGRDKDRVRYTTYDTGVGRECEVEGLAFEPTDRVLLVPCKRARVEALEDSVVIFRWSSAIERHPETGTYFLISARRRAIAEITSAGDVLDIRELPEDPHRQPEGIAFTPDLSLLIADEGERRGHLTVYRRSQPRQ
jgi:uncharacterized protein YjiK